MLPPRADSVLEAALYADDLAAAEAFWHGVMGLEVVTRVEGRHVFFRLGQAVLLVFDPQAAAIPTNNPRLPVPPHGARGPGHLCLAADDTELDRWRRHLEAAGVMIEADFRWPNGARSIYFRDPAGNSIEIADPALWNG